MQLICQLTAQFMSSIPTPRLHWPPTVVIFLQLPPTAWLPVYMFTVALLCTAGVINKQRPCNYALELSLQLPVGVKIAYWHKLISQQHPASQPASHRQLLALIGPIGQQLVLPTDWLRLGASVCPAEGLIRLTMQHVVYIVYAYIDYSGQALEIRY